MSFPQPDLSYMKPPKAAYDIKHTENYIVNGKPPRYSRMVYNKVPYQPFEEQKITDFKTDIGKATDVKLPEDWVESDYLKVLQCCDFKRKLSIPTLKAHLQWRNDVLSQTLHTGNLPLLEKGILYVHGRDRQYRPIVILNAYLIDPKKNTPESMCQAISYILGQVVKVMMIPYHIENWIMIIETKKLGLSSLPLSALGKIIGNMQTNFCGRLEKMYILNPSTGINIAWKTLSGFVDPVTKQKIGFLDAKNIQQLQEKIDPNQLEVKYGGTRPDVTKYWLPENIDPLPTEEEQALEKKEFVIEAINIEPVKEMSPQHEPTPHQQHYIQEQQEANPQEIEDPKLEQLDPTPSSNAEDQFKQTNPLFEQTPLLNMEGPEFREYHNQEQPEERESEHEKESAHHQVCHIISNHQIPETAEQENQPYTATIVHIEEPEYPPMSSVKEQELAMKGREPLVQETQQSTKFEGPVNNKACCSTCSIF